jgi:hypothetical protein
MSHTIQNQKCDGAGECGAGQATAERILPEARIIGAVPLPLRRFGGATLQRLCLARKVCTNTRCWVQPFCKCARADWAAAKKAEFRIWLGLTVCGGVVLAIALFRAMAIG